LLNGRGEKPRIFDPVVRADVIDLGSRPELRDDVERFVQHVAASLVIPFLAELVVFTCAFAGADAQHDTAARQPVE
jgi:hypothetical protein